MSGAAMRGGIEIDDMHKYPEAKYWEMGAKGARDKILLLVPEERDQQLSRVLGRFWRRDNSWMTICLRTERMLDLLKTLKHG